MQVAQVVPQGTAQQEFHAEVIHLLGAGLLGLFLALVAAPDHQVPKNQGDCFIILLIGGVFRTDTEVVGKLFLDEGFNLRDSEGIIHKDRASKLKIYKRDISGNRTFFCDLPEAPILRRSSLTIHGSGTEKPSLREIPGYCYYIPNNALIQGGRGQLADFHKIVIFWLPHAKFCTFSKEFGHFGNREIYDSLLCKLNRFFVLC